MIKAKRQDKNLINEILTESFKNNKSVLFAVKNDKKEKERIKILIDYSIDFGHRFGEVFVSDDKKASCIVLYPEKIKPTFKFEVLWNISLAINVIGLANVMSVLKQQSAIKKHHPKESFYHLWYIGVSPELQGQGKGSGLMNQVLEYLDSKPRPVYLETSTVRNIPWYQRFNFQIIDKLQFSYELNIMKREIPSL